MPENFLISDKIVVVHELNCMCNSKRFEQAFSLLSRFFYSDYSEQDPTKRDAIEMKINVALHFCRALVFSLRDSDVDEACQIIASYAQKLDFTGDAPEYLSSMLYYSYDTANIALSLKLIDQLRAKNVKIKVFIYFNLLKHNFTRKLRS